MKKFMWIAVLMTAFIMGNVFAQEGTPNPASDFLYELDSKGEGVRITEYIGKAKYVVIPSEIEGLPVTECGDIFRNDMGTNKSRNFVEGIEFPDTMNSGNIRLNEMPVLKTIKFAGSIKEVGLSILKSLETLILPQTCEEFYIELCPKLKSLDIPKSVIKIGNLCTGSPEIKNLVLPEGIKEVTIKDLQNEYNAIGWPASDRMCHVESIEFLGSNYKKIELKKLPYLKKLIFPEEPSSAKQTMVRIEYCDALAEIVNLDTIISTAYPIENMYKSYVVGRVSLPLVEQAKLKKARWIRN